MAFASKQWAVNLRITESSPLAAGTADFTLKYWVVPGTTGTERTQAEACASNQCQTLMATASGRSTVILSSAATGVTR